MIVVPEAARPFAEVQIGELDEWRGKPDWLGLVDALALRRFETIRPFLPDTCRRVLDIGGGVAAFDVPILNHYAPTPELWVLDGDGGQPFVERHDRPFNSRAATAALLEANGHSLGGFLTPDMRNAADLGKCDLVVSFASWGFHFAPYRYLDLVMGHLAAGARVIFDLRIGKDEWRRVFDQRLRFVGMAYESLKFDRLVYERK